jgi:hypothetical protein
MTPLMETFMVLFVTFISLLLKFVPVFCYFQLLSFNFLKLCIIKFCKPLLDLCANILHAKNPVLINFANLMSTFIRPDIAVTLLTLPIEFKQKAGYIGRDTCT